MALFNKKALENYLKTGEYTVPAAESVPFSPAEYIAKFKKHFAYRDDYTPRHGYAETRDAIADECALRQPYDTAARDKEGDAVMLLVASGDPEGVEAGKKLGDCLMKNEDDKETLLERMSEVYKALSSLAAKQDEQARQSVAQDAAVERYLALDAAPVDLAAHDRRFHPNGFDPKRDSCGLRDELDKGDSPDAAVSPAPQPQGGNSPQNFTKDAILARRPEIREDYEAMEKLGNRTDASGVTHPTRILSATGKPISKELDDYITACMAGEDVPDELIKATPEWKQAESRKDRDVEPFKDLINAKGKVDTSFLPDDSVCADGRTRGEVRNAILDTMLAPTVTAEINEALKTDKKTGKPKHPPYEVERGRRIDLVIGRPSAGKSSAFVNELSVAHKARVCDSDTIKTMLPEFDDGYGAGVVHEESAELNEVVLLKSREKGENIVYPLLGKTAAKLENYLDAFKNAGYSVHLHFNHLPAAKAKGRMMKRWLETNRFLGLENISGAKGIDKVYKQVKDRFDSAEAKTNDVPFGEKPRIFEP